MTALEGWDNFYVIVGSSAGALIGLQFVVITLIADAPIANSDAQAGGAFTTPSVVHFGVVLLLSAIVSAPWHGIGPVTILWALTGLYGIIYSLIVVRRLRVQTAYKPVFEGWLFHVVLPLAAYAALAASAGTAYSFSHSYTQPAASPRVSALSSPTLSLASGWSSSRNRNENCIRARQSAEA